MNTNASHLIDQCSLIIPTQRDAHGMHPGQLRTVLQSNVVWCQSVVSDIPRRLGLALAQNPLTRSDRGRCHTRSVLARRANRSDTLAYEPHRQNQARHEGGFVQRQCI
jgi:hypothetical protein